MESTRWVIGEAEGKVPSAGTQVTKAETVGWA